jgi:hypothetical protein
MALHWSLDKYRLIASLLHDVSRCHGAVFNHSALNKTLRKVQRRVSSEGDSFFSKTMPKLAKALDKALTLDHPLNAAELRWKSLPNSQLPRFLGELFSRVLGPDGLPLQEPCTQCIAALRLVLYTWYKYEEPYSAECEQQVLAKFERTEQELTTVSAKLDNIRHILDEPAFANSRRHKGTDLLTLHGKQGSF